VKEGRRREVVTPEGVPLRFELAGVGDRAAAFLLDGLIIVATAVGSMLLLLILFAALSAAGGGAAVNVLLLLTFFFLRNLYFTFFESLWRGATPGKRLLRLRVIDRSGGPLTAEAVFARNLMREVEIFLPLLVLLAPSSVWPGVSGWVQLVSAAWLVILALLPFFNRDHLRAGDLVGGTLVVRAPRVLLLDDLSGDVVPPEARVAFTNEQLDLYGIYELQVLEDLLRRAPNFGTLAEVAARIQAKIGWQRAPGESPEAFLRTFYTAQRARLEQRMLLGERRERKREGRLTRKP
jgi:uncharacterized RDD family membrane protein YckC